MGDSFKVRVLYVSAITLTDGFLFVMLISLSVKNIFW